MAVSHTNREVGEENRVEREGQVGPHQLAQHLTDTRRRFVSRVTFYRPKIKKKKLSKMEKYTYLSTRPINVF